MRRSALGLSLSLVFVGIIACDGSVVLSTPAPTVDRIAVGVSGTLTAQAEATAVAATVAALSQTKPNANISPTTPPLIAPPEVPPPPIAQPVVSPTPTPTPMPPPLPPPSVYYNLVVRYSKNCLSVQGNQAVEATCSQSTQLWNLPADTTSWYFQVQLQSSGKCLSASSNHETEPFIVTDCRGDESQLWQKRLSGGYFQLANQTILAEDPTNMCIDARQWDQPPIQWPCKPWGTDDQLDNQLLCQTTTTTDTCTPPPGVYVTNIQQDPPFTDEGKPNTFHINFRVTFSNTTGNSQSYRWFVQVFGQPNGQTEERVLTIPSGTPTITVGPWNIGRACADFTAKAVWRRASDGLLFAFKDPDGREYSLSFQIHTAC